MVFKAGEPSANPNGRPPNSGARQKLFAELIEPKKNEIVGVALKLALEGNENLLRVLLEKLLPAKPTDDPLPSIPLLQGTLAEQGRTVLNLITSGELTPSQGATLLQSITAQAKLIETDEILKRIEKLEEQCHVNKLRKQIK